MGESAGFVSGYKEYVAGMLAGVATVIVGHPFDTVKVPPSLSLSRSLFVCDCFLDWHSGGLFFATHFLTTFWLRTDHVVI